MPKKKSSRKPPRKPGKRKPARPGKRKPVRKARAGKSAKKAPPRKKAPKKTAKKKVARKKASGRPAARTKVKGARGKKVGRAAPARRVPVERRDKAFFEHFRKRLLEERERITRRLDDLRMELSGLQEMPRELEEWAQEEKDRDILIRLEEREAGELRRIQAALERIDDGSYGLCQICGKTIPRDRLEELPTAFRCIEHTL